VDIGDKILFIDRQTVAGLSLSQVGARMAGPEGLSLFFSASLPLPLGAGADCARTTRTIGVQMDLQKNAVLERWFVA